MAHILVVSYSRTGHTRKLAEAIAAACGADREDILEEGSRRGLLGWLRSLREAVLQRPATIYAARHDPGAYDLVILGTPVWASCMASPVRAYIGAHGSRIGNLALFCSLGGSGADKAMAAMAKACGKAPVARMAVTEAELRSGAYQAKVEAFVAGLSGGKAALDPALPAKVTPVS